MPLISYHNINELYTIAEVVYTFPVRLIAVKSQTYVRKPIQSWILVVHVTL